MGRIGNPSYRPAGPRPEGRFEFSCRPFYAKVMEAHVGQIEYAPEGWLRIATKGTGGLTPMQCLRVKDRYIYAAQFHMMRS